MTCRFINIHTHSGVETNTNPCAIVNLHEEFQLHSSTGMYSVGLHPCYLDGYNKNMIIVEKTATDPRVKAIGECGLDRFSTTPMEQQSEVFLKHIALAKKLRKPMIIHCVKAFDELLQLLKAEQIDVPVVFHGYNKKADIARRVLEEGYYLSFGRAILNNSSPAATVLKSMPADRFFLETDAASIAIEEVYNKASEIRNTDLDVLILQVQENFKRVFRHDD